MNEPETSVEDHKLAFYEPQMILWLMDELKKGL